jgi:hypothetical protein
LRRARGEDEHGCGCLGEEAVVRLVLRPLAVVGLLLAVPACGAGDGGSAPEATTAPSAPDTTIAAATTAPPSSAATTAAPDATTSPGAAPTTAPATPATSAPRTTVDVKVYLLRGERLVIAHRDVPGPEVLRGALTELLAGPTVTEETSGLGTAVPAGTQLLDLALADGQATVDLDSTFGSGGGSASMLARVGQVVFTATQFSNVDRVLFLMDGEPVEALGGEGLVLTEPQTRAMTDRNLSGSVLVDTPGWGGSVTSPFTVTGEGDVFEAQFPIEIWRDGQQIGGVAPVWAGAWGTWKPFAATIVLDAAPGPIELVAYDPGGCGTDPECPPIVKTSVPLTLLGLVPTT